MRVAFKLVVLSALAYAGVRLLLRPDSSLLQDDRNDHQGRPETVANSYYDAYELFF